MELSPRVLAQRAGSRVQDEVFSNADLPLGRIAAYGFDFDYTLASYNDNVSITIYQMAQSQTSYTCTLLDYGGRQTKAALRM